MKRFIVAVSLLLASAAAIPTENIEAAHITASTPGDSVAAAAPRRRDEGIEVPSHRVPAPFYASEEMIRIMRGPFLDWNRIANGWQSSSRDVLKRPPNDLAEWRSLMAYLEPQFTEDLKRGTRNGAGVIPLDCVDEKWGLTAKTIKLGGVPVIVVTPPDMAASHKGRVLIYFHGGGYMFGSGVESQAFQLAHATRTKVISVSYRLTSEAPFPAALDDSIAVWREVIRKYRPANVGIGGAAAGGGLALATVLRLHESASPLPGAVYTFTLCADSTLQGDTIYTNEGLDTGLGGTTDWWRSAFRAYAGDHDVRDPLISPAFGDYGSFPPTILVTGTRDMLLSDSVLVYRKLRQKDVASELYLVEGESHGENVVFYQSPESHDWYREISRFLDRHLRSGPGRWADRPFKQGHQ